MATVIQDHYTTQFSTNWQFLVQQMESRLKEWVTVDTIKGKEKSYNQLGTTSARKITTRNGATVPSNETKEKRWCRLEPYDAVTHFDEWDEGLLGEVVLPTSSTVESHAMAYGRNCDEVIISALGGTNYVGATGVTAQTLDSTAVAADYKDLTSLTGGGTDYNLTINKLVRAKMILEQTEAYDKRYGGQLCIAVTAAQTAGLLTDAIEVQSSDFNQIQALHRGEIDEYAGFKFLRTELLGFSSGTVRQCFAWVKSGVLLGLGAERSVKISIRDDLNETLQIRSKWMHGGTRLQEEKVISILCEETAASTV